MNDDEMRELERKSRAAFDASVESQDAAMRSRLARARAKALEELHRPRLAGSGIWVPVGAAAATVFATLLLKSEVRGGQEVPAVAAVALEDLAPPGNAAGPAPAAAAALRTRIRRTTVGGLFPRCPMRRSSARMTG